MEKNVPSLKLRLNVTATSGRFRKHSKIVYEPYMESIISLNLTRVSDMTRSTRVETLNSRTLS